MNSSANNVLRQALTLPEDDRAEIASRLLESLPGPPFASADIAGEWDKELQRRMDAVERGEVALLPWNDVKKELWDKYGPSH